MAVDPQVEAFFNEVERRFGECAMHTADFATGEAAMEWLSGLPFATGAKSSPTLPANMIARGFRSPNKTVTLVVAGKMSVDENYEIRKHAKSRGVKISSTAAGNTAMKNLSDASDRLKAEEASKKPWWKFW